MNFIYLNCGSDEINAKKIVPVKDATSAVAKKPEKIQACLTLTSLRYGCSALLSELASQHSDDLLLCIYFFTRIAIPTLNSFIHHFNLEPI